jgi:hypothetical protein
MCVFLVFLCCAVWGVVVVGVKGEREREER